MKPFAHVVLPCALMLFACLNAATGGDKAVKYMEKADPVDAYVRAPNHNIADLSLNEETVAALAETLLVYIYGENVLKQKPWLVTDLGAAYKVEGQLPKNYWGGVAEIVIRKTDAKVLSFAHGK